MNVRIRIEALGPSASGKSLAISDMMQGLRDYNHFREFTYEQSICEGTKEVVEFTLHIVDQRPIEHETN